MAVVNVDISTADTYTEDNINTNIDTAQSYRLSVAHFPAIFLTGLNASLFFIKYRDSFVFRGFLLVSTIYQKKKKNQLIV